MAGDSPATSPREETIWSGHPSQVLNFWIYVVCGALFFLIAPLLVALWEYFKLRSIKYEISTERLRITTGMFSRSFEEIELYRVRDYRLEQPFLLRMFHLYNIHLVTSDKSTPTVTLEGIADGPALRDTLRKHVERMRKEKGIREIDME